MPIAKDVPIVLVESRWRPYGQRPHSGEIFVGRYGTKVWDRLFQMKKNGDVTYLGDSSTVLGHSGDWFTHWMPVGELPGEEW